MEWFGCLGGIENSLQTIFKIMSSSGNKLKGTTKAISVSASESEVTEHKRKKNSRIRSNSLSNSKLESNLIRMGFRVILILGATNEARSWKTPIFIIMYNNLLAKAWRNNKISFSFSQFISHMHCNAAALFLFK